MFPLGLGEMLRVFVNLLTADGKYPIEHWEKFATPNSNAIIWKMKDFFWIFYSISGICINF